MKDKRIADAIMLLLKHPQAVTFGTLGIVARADECSKHGDIATALTLMRSLADTLPEDEREAYNDVLSTSRQVEIVL